MIGITKISEDLFEVTVKGSIATRHEVTLSEAYYQKLTSGKISRTELIRQSFEFLLKRESNTMILRKFDLPVIGRYFPEYEMFISGKI
jgi:hypothetical protein